MNALITGSSSGLGRELALTFARKGHGIILHGRDEVRLCQVAKEIRDLNPTETADPGLPPDIVIGDLADDATIRRLREAALVREVYVLINNAGRYYSGPAEAMSPDDADDIIRTNLIAPIKLILAVYPMMATRKRGLIVNINSLAGKGFNDQEAAYCASKWGLRGFMGSFKYAAREKNVSVLDVFIGKMKTPMTERLSAGGRMIDPADAAQAIYDLWMAYPSLRVNEVEIGRA